MFQSMSQTHHSGQSSQAAELAYMGLMVARKRLLFHNSIVNNVTDLTEYKLCPQQFGFSSTKNRLLIRVILSMTNDMQYFLDRSSSHKRKFFHNFVSPSFLWRALLSFHWCCTEHDIHCRKCSSPKPNPDIKLSTLVLQLPWCNSRQASAQ